MKDQLPPGVKLVKTRLDSGSLIRTLYEVVKGEKRIGYVWSREGFSYRGSQGWNRGIRYKDFHPIEWKYGVDYSLWSRGSDAYSRRSAVDRLLSQVNG